MGLVRRVHLSIYTFDVNLCLKGHSLKNVWFAWECRSVGTIADTLMARSPHTMHFKQSFFCFQGLWTPGPSAYTSLGQSTETCAANTKLLDLARNLWLQSARLSLVQLVFVARLLARRMKQPEGCASSKSSCT